MAEPAELRNRLADLKAQTPAEVGSWELAKRQVTEQKALLIKEVLHERRTVFIPNVDTPWR